MPSLWIVWAKLKGRTCCLCCLPIVLQVWRVFLKRQKISAGPLLFFPGGICRPAGILPRFGPAGPLAAWRVPDHQWSQASRGRASAVSSGWVFLKSEMPLLRAGLGLVCFWHWGGSSPFCIGLAGKHGEQSPQGNSALVVAKEKGSKTEERASPRLKGRRSGAPETKGEQTSSLWYKCNFIWNRKVILKFSQCSCCLSCS